MNRRRFIKGCKLLVVVIVAVVVMLSELSTYNLQLKTYNLQPL